MTPRAAVLPLLPLTAIKHETMRKKEDTAIDIPTNLCPPLRPLHLTLHELTLESHVQFRDETQGLMVDLAIS